MTVVRNLCLRMLRPWVQQRRALGDVVVDVHDVADTQLDPHEVLQRWELIQRVHIGIAALDPRSREVLVLRDLEGLSGEETCRALDVPLATMKTRLHRARAALREHLEQDNVDDAPRN
jgi:RNA polymerase sigma-70 factor (ECF subfamily)